MSRFSPTKGKALTIYSSQNQVYLDYYKINLQTDPSLRELILAFLSNDLEAVDTFEETETGLHAYLPIKAYTEEVKTYLENLQQQFDFTFELETIKGQNWNAIWEANFQPIIVGDFCGIRADFHEPLPQVQHEITINPRMAFGTGHHATTFMVIETMETLDFAHTKVLDYGCGTGILAILAAKLGAKKIDAVDIEEPSYQNTIENAQRNHTPQVETYLGTLEQITDSGYDIILANINRNVILASLSTLYDKLLKNGKLIVSGFIRADRELLLQAAKNQGFILTLSTEKENWICLTFQK